MLNKKYKGRYKIIKLGHGFYTIQDQEYKYIGYPTFNLRLEAEMFRAGLHSLSVDEYRMWTGHGRRKGGRR